MTESSPRTSKFVTIQNTENYNFWTVLFVSGGILVLYSLSRIIALQRRVRDLEARPPVDDIVMRGMIRQQVSEMVKDTLSELENRTKQAAEIKYSKPVVTVPIPVETVRVVEKPVEKPIEKPIEKITEDKVYVFAESSDAKIILSDLKSSLDEIDVITKDKLSTVEDEVPVVLSKPKRKVKKIVT